MTGGIKKLFFYNVQYECHSMKPPKAVQQIASEKAEAGVDLVAEVRAMLAVEFKRAPDEIEILRIRGKSDPTQVWPVPVVVAEGAADGAAVAGSVGQGEGLADLENLDELTRPDWTPATPPPAAFPTVEEAGTLIKADMFELAKRLELDIVKDPNAKFPAVRAAVLTELSARQASQPAA